MSAYMLWLNSSRERIKSENPGISITEISKKAGEMWRQLGKEEKEVRPADYKDGYFSLVYWSSVDVKCFKWCRTTFQGTSASSPMSFWSAACCVKSIIPFIVLLPLLLQEWETKAGEAKEEYEKAKKEYKESGMMPTSTSKKWDSYQINLCSSQTWNNSFSAWLIY